MSNFGRYLKTEIECMKEFRRTESIRQGRELTSNEAALLWAATKAAEFRANYRGDILDGRQTGESSSITEP